MPKTIRELSPKTILAGTLILSALPLAAVELFPGFLKFVLAPASYLLFHNITEFFSIMVSLSMFGLGWFTYEQSKDRQALFLSTAFLGIGLMDFMHTLANAAMPPFITPNSSNKSIQFWIAVRLFQAITFLVSAFVYTEKPVRWLSKKVLITSALLVSFLVFTGIIFFPSHIPATFVPGVGLTPFKRISEYLIIGLLSAAAAAYFRRITRTGDRLLLFYLAAFVICIFSELPLALYTRVFDTYNVLGHLYKVAAFFLIYYGIYKASVKNPYIKLAETSRRLQAANEAIQERTRELQEAQRLAQSIVETIWEPLVVLGADLRVIYANSAFYANIKVITQETEGRFIYDIDHRQWDIPRLRALLEVIVPTNTYFQDFEVDHEFPSIGPRNMLLNARRIYQEGQGTQMILLAMQDITEHKRADEALRESERRLRDLSSQLLVSQENERRKIAGEIHDGLGQVLSSAKFKLEDGINRAIEGPIDQGAAPLKLSLSLLQEAIDEARRIQLDLRPAILDDLGIIATLSWFSRRFQTTYPEIRIQQETGIREEEIPESLKTVIYRISQEAFNNIAKYSQADLVNLSLRKANGAIELTIRDNGQGFDPQEVSSPEKPRKGLGLTSMQERANLSGGSCTIESSKGAGTTIRASWPLG
ncbi:MAG: PAS domain-containing protein [Deltaproteobacteria bacterium]|nr:PAS domain-containing protein [Deltaproteobacteria bacterium]